MDKRLKIVSVGAGTIGGLHQRAYLANPRAEIVAICDRIEEKAKKRAAELGVAQWYTSIGEMMKHVDCDFIDVVTQDVDHFEPVMECLEYGKPVMTEKPLAMTVKEAEQMVAKADEKGVFLAIDYNRRYAPGYAHAKKWIDAGECGKIAYIDMKLSQGGPFSSKKGEYYLLFELLNHSIDLLRWFAGDIVGVYAQMGKIQEAKAKPGEPVCWTSMAMSFRFAGGAVATLMGSWDSDFTHPIERTEICGEKGEISVDNIISGATLMRKGDQVVKEYRPSIFHQVPHEYNQALAPRMDALVDDLLAGNPPYPLGKDGLESLRTADALIRSWEEKKEITL